MKRAERERLLIAGILISGFVAFMAYGAMQNSPVN
jgi:hypothetical protein